MTRLGERFAGVSRRLVRLMVPVLVASAPLSPVHSAPSMLRHSASMNTEELATHADGQLQQALEKLVREQGLWGQVASHRLALGLVDVTDVDAPRYAALNPNQMMYAASLPKIAILLGAFVEIGDGELKLDPGLREEMVRMIRFSDNASATRVLERVGRQDLINILTSDKFKLYDRDFNGGLWVGKDYARNNAYQRDPLSNLSHGATIYQVARFFYLLEKGQLVAPRYRTDMMRILSKPGISHKFVAGLKNHPEVRMYRKSGTWRDYHADAALVETDSHRYIIVGLAQHKEAGKWFSRLAEPMHNLVVNWPASANGRQRVALRP